MNIARPFFLPLNLMAKKTDTPVTYQLKPGNHAFAPGGPALHNCENTSAEELAWYIEHYPHVKDLCEPLAAADQESAANG